MSDGSVRGDSVLVVWLKRRRSELIHGLWRRLKMWAAVGAGHRIANRFGAFGEGSYMGFPTGTIYGERWIQVGRDTLLADHVTLSAGMHPDQEMVTNPVIHIGDRCLIGRYNSIVGHFSINIGDDVFTGTDVYITDQNHTYADIDEPIGRQIPVESAVKIGRGSWLGSGVVILPGCQIGENVVVAANSVVRGTVPDRCVVAGVPAKIVRRHDSENGWQRPPT